jgi:hypothetical protein
MVVGATSDDDLQRIVAQGGRRGEIHERLRALRDAHADRIRTRYPRIPRRVSSYNLDRLLPESGFQVARALVGSEGTCATVLQAELRLVWSPPGRDCQRAAVSSGPCAARPAHRPEGSGYSPRVSRAERDAMTCRRTTPRPGR